MSFTSSDYKQLQKLMHENPENRELLQKLLDSHHYAISKISHEIRNPLAFIYSTFQLIETQHPEVKQFKYWNEMGEDLTFMEQLLNELSTYNNSKNLHLELISSEELLQNLCLTFAASCVDHNIEFTSHLTPDLPMLCGDKIKLREVFLNLLKNAYEAIDSHGHIRLDAYARSHMLYVSISDDGCGISPENLSSLFDAFVTQKAGGTGLGLSIVKQTIDAHGGTITVTSEPNIGSTFLIQIPTNIN